MRRRTLALAPALAVVAVGSFAGLASAHQPEPDSPPLHAHILVLGLELDEAGNPVDVRRCIDLAANNALPLTAHHHALHIGTGGEALFEAGHVVAPTAPLAPWANCAEALEFFGIE